MRSERSTTLDDVERWLEALPARLGVWRTTSRREFWPLLAWLNVWPVQEFRQTAAEIGPELAVATRHAELYNTVGLAVRWAETYLRETVLGTSEEMERRGLARCATDAWQVGDLLRSSRAGVYEFSSDGNDLHFEFARDPDIEALDNLLDLVWELHKTEQLRIRLRGEDGSEAVPIDELRAYVRASEAGVPWEAVEDRIKEGFRVFAEKMVTGMRRVSAPDSLGIDGFRLGEALAVWRELLAAALYRNMCILAGTVNPLVSAPARPSVQLLTDLAPSGVDPSVIERVVRFLTFDPDRDEDPCLAPIIRTDHGLVPMSSLIAPGSPERNILAKARSDPDLFGRIGQQVGRIGPATVGEALKRVPGVRVATEVKVKGPDGQSLGDLDAVAVDEADRLVAAFEVKWQLEPDGAKEIDKVEAQAEEGQAQIRRLRRPVESGKAPIRWPQGWPSLEGFEWRWFVITSNVIPITRIASGDVPARSHKVLTMMALRARSPLREVCDMFCNPALPEEGKQYLVETSTRRIGPYTITVRAPS
jgi:hypothetical protein